MIVETTAIEQENAMKRKMLLETEVRKTIAGAGLKGSVVHLCIYYDFCLVFKVRW